MDIIDKLTVKYRNREVGTLMLSHDSAQCVFCYSADWIADGFSISPLELPLENKMFIAPRTPFYGNFGIFEDSMPDGYGRYLINRLLREKGIDDFTLTPLQRLSIIGSAGMGALEYVPQTLLTDKKITPNLSEIQQLALNVLSDKSTEKIETLYYNSGNSGGCRPKCTFTDNEGHWLVKFRHTYDPADIGVREYNIMLLAQQCGIEIPRIKLIENKYFASERFDISQNSEREHVATAAALMSVSINPPTSDYKTLLSLTGFLTQSPQAVEQMFRRMVFNVLIENKDDHAKNFSFICRKGKWSLAPAYDLLPFPEGYHGEHATSVMGKGNPTEEDLLMTGETIRINRSQGKKIIEEIKQKLNK